MANDVMYIRTSASYQDLHNFKSKLGAQTLHNFNHFNQGEIYHEFYVYCKDKIVAYGFLRDSLHPHKKHLCVLGMVVADKWQGTGVGTRLGLHMIAWASTKYTKIALGVYLDNTRAYRFYRKLGFTVEGILEKEELQDDEYRDLITMAMYL